jgi:hypothetical protein
LVLRRRLRRLPSRFQKLRPLRTICQFNL